MSVQNTHHKVSLARLGGKRVEAAFDGGLLTSDSGVVLLREVEARMGLLDRIVQVVTERRHPGYVEHPLADLVHQRVFQMACGYEDANDCNTLRQDPAFKAACERLPVTGAALASQPTMSRFENQITRSDLYRIAQAFVDLFIASYKKPPKAILLDIDDTEDKVYGSQQWSLFNGYFKSNCYQPLHIYEGQTGKLITTLLRPGARPFGPQMVTLLRRLVKYLRQAWPEVVIFLRGDAHFSCPEVHDFCDRHEVYFALGQAGNAPLSASGHPLMAQAKALYRETGQPVQLFTCFPYQAHTWAGPRRIIYKAEVTVRGRPMRASSSPTWTAASPHSSTKPSIADAAGWKALSRITRPFSIPTAPLVTPLKPTTSVSFSIQPPMS